MTRISRRRQVIYAGVIAFTFIFLITMHKLSVEFPTDPTLVALDSHLYLTTTQPQEKLSEKVEAKVDKPHDRKFHAKDVPSNPYKSFVKPLPHELPWYMKGGEKRPTADSERRSKLLPEENDGDRIENQLMFVQPRSQPENSNQFWVRKTSTPKEKLKTIYVTSGFYVWATVEGQRVFKDQKCPVDTCYITKATSKAKTADAVIVKDSMSPLDIGKRNPSQIWIMYLLESPLHTGHSHTKFNWTATYRHDSDIVAPYEKYSYYDPSIRQIEQTTNYAAGKTKKVAWFVSNCGDIYRLNMARKLKEHIDVHIYGSCGEYSCPRSKHRNCFDMLKKDYKFYLSFENSRCRDYITEKFFINGLSNNVIPIVMGAPYEDYARVAPEHSFIHVDEFPSVEELAKYLHHLDQNDEEYNSYFRWKGTGEFINTYFMCRVCAMLHADVPPKHYKDIGEWWRGYGVCVTGSWRDYFKHQKTENAIKKN